jgi:hypothetical protein
MQELTLPKKPFNVATFVKHFEEYKDGKKTRQTVIDYIQSYYFETNGRNYYMYNQDSDSFSHVLKKDFTSEILEKINNDKDIVKYFTTNTKFYKLVNKIHSPRHYTITNEDGEISYYINCCVGLLYKNVKPYDSYSVEDKKGVQMMVQFMREVFCDNNEELLTQFLKYWAQVCSGKRTDVIIYIKSPIQGTGKSTLPEFMMQYVIGEKLCCTATTECLTGTFNKILMGKLFVLFEELPTFSTKSWMSASSMIKSYTTNPKIQIRGLREEVVEVENTFNGYINTNVEALQDSQGRRIIIMPISSKQYRQFDYFENLRAKCFNNKVGEAFFAYLKTFDISNFYAQRDIPETEEKKMSQSINLSTEQKFLKNLLLKRIDNGKVITTLLYQWYSEYCKNCGIDKYLGPTKFYNVLQQLGFTKTRNGNDYCFNVSTEVLKEMAQKFGWLSDCINVDDLIISPIQKEPLEDTINISKQEYEEYLEWKKLKNEFLEWKNSKTEDAPKKRIIKIKKPHPPVKVIDDPLNLIESLLTPLGALKVSD